MTVSINKRKLYQAYRHAVECAAILEAMRNEIKEPVTAHDTFLEIMCDGAKNITQDFDLFCRARFGKKAQELEVYK